MNFNKKDLKKIMYDFNSISNRLMKVDFNEYSTVLKKFITYIEACTIIYDYTKDCGGPSFDIAEDVSSISKSRGREYFDLGETEQEEVSNIYHVLKYVVDNNIEIHYGLAMAYAVGSTNYQDRIKGFNERVVLVLIRYIEGYLTKIGIDMGLDETAKYSITVNNGQVNLASDNAVITATQNNGINHTELKTLIGAIFDKLPNDISSEDKESVTEGIEVIESELSQPKPKKSLIKNAISTIQAVKGTVEFGTAVAELVQLVQSML